ncbi:hypothetical protein N7468_006453 [Penicillium chermesinum]|uniref:Uncharacterized protein n=1 Tax=Penicillium chermesinum TaxID=63820 RepID=A0A9W9TJP5_9EURO|nr:uncharacterized protein N7468_006453 [Penicillium chermesinum]KAJ5225228.1 hypothetical protein N7468_006453 [Penicillium chermesinum]
MIGTAATMSNIAEELVHRPHMSHLGVAKHPGSNHLLPPVCRAWGQIMGLTGSTWPTGGPSRRTMQKLIGLNKLEWAPISQAIDVYNGSFQHAGATNSRSRNFHQMDPNQRGPK